MISRRKLALLLKRFNEGPVMLKINRIITSEMAKDAGLVLVLGSMILYHFFKMKSFFLGAVIILLLTMTCPSIFKIWARLWLGFSDFLGRYVSMAVMSMAFYCLVVPIGMARRFLGKDPLMLNCWKRDTGSVMTERNHLFSKKDIERPF
jgi:hypothetical protein